MEVRLPLRTSPHPSKALVTSPRTWDKSTRLLGSVAGLNGTKHVKSAARARDTCWDCVPLSFLEYIYKVLSGTRGLKSGPVKTGPSLREKIDPNKDAS